MSVFTQLKKYFQHPFYTDLLFATLKNASSCWLLQQHGKNIRCRFKKYGFKGNWHSQSVYKQHHRPTSLMEDSNWSPMHSTDKV